MKKIIVLLLTMCLFFNILSIQTYAAYDNNTTATYGGKTLPIGSYNNGKKFKDTVDGAVQCLGFAFYVQNQLFGFHYKNTGNVNGDKFNVKKGNNGNIYVNSVEETKALFDGVTLGAHIRTGKDIISKNGNKYSHSMIFMKSDNSHVWTYEGNADGKYGVYVVKRTWEQMYNYLAYKKNGVIYIATPKAQYYGDIVNDAVNGNDSANNNHIHDFTYDVANEKCYCGAQFTRQYQDINQKYTVIKDGTAVKSKPYSECGERYARLNIGDVVTVKRTFKNVYGNVWCEVDTGQNTGYMYFGDLKGESNLAINLTAYPSSIKVGSSFGLRGSISSNYNIKKVSGYIMQGNTVIQSTTDMPEAKTMDIRPANLNQRLLFNQLSVGDYSLYIEAVDASGKVVTATKSFTVENTSVSQNVSPPSAPEQSETTSIRFELETIPSGNLPYGKPFTLKGWFRSDSPIVEARAYMLDANQNIVMQSDKASSTTSNYQIQGYKLDKAMKFNQLSPGGYYLKYFVRDANGDTATWISDMFYIVK